MNREVERILVRKVQEDACLTSFTQLLKELQLYGCIYRYVQKRLFNSADAEEVTQETIFRAFEKIQGFDPTRGRFRSWALGIANRKVYDRLSKRTHLPLEGTEKFPVPFRSIEEQLVMAEHRGFLLRALESLQERPLRILRCFYVEGLSQQEIAARENITTNNVGTILYRARNQWLKKYKALLKTEVRPKRLLKDITPTQESFGQMFTFIHQQLARQ